MLPDLPIIPEGYCNCGCGAKTPISTITKTAKGYIKGKPHRFLKGHTTKAPVAYLVDDVTGCWVWQRATGFKGYGCMRVNGRLVGAHRVYFQKYTGIDPGPNDVCHKCDNPPCVNPDHLFLGNASINTRDMMSKGRSRFWFYKGMRGLRCILNEKSVSEIKQALKEGKETKASIGRRYGVTKQAIYLIAKGRNWPHVK